MTIRVKARTKIPAQAASLLAGPLNVPLIMQPTGSNWCWAACADMTAAYYGNTGVAQCDFANFLFGLDGCCASPSSPLCDQGASAQDIVKVYSNYGINSTLSESTVSFSSLDFEVSNSRPVEVGYQWFDSQGRPDGGHVALVIQTGVANNQEAVRVNDPAYGSGGVLYSNLLTAYGQGRWIATWTNIRR